jgi:hypothetical protein
VACPSVRHCTAINDSQAVTFDPATPGTAATITTVDSDNGLTAVACPSVRQCTAVDDYGHVVTFNGDKQIWATPSYSPPSGGFDDVLVACPAPSQCTAIYTDEDGEAATFDPDKPHARVTRPADDPYADVTSVACPSPVQCTTVDLNGEAVTFDPRTQEPSTS